MKNNITNQDIKPIETSYSGYRFRSRLEARWAIFLDAIKIDWEYEKEGFDLGGIFYLPDFWIPKKKIWIEIKGDAPSSEDLEKASRLYRATNQEVWVLVGQIGDKTAAILASEINHDRPELDPAWNRHVIGFCRRCNGFGRIVYDDFDGPYAWSMYCDPDCNCDRVPLMPGHALQSALSARFEHGEKGTRQ